MGPPKFILYAMFPSLVGSISVLAAQEDIIIANRDNHNDNFILDKITSYFNNTVLLLSIFIIFEKVIPHIKLSFDISQENMCDIDLCDQYVPTYKLTKLHQAMQCSVTNYQYLSVYFLAVFQNQYPTQCQLQDQLTLRFSSSQPRYDQYHLI